MLTAKPEIVTVQEQFGLLSPRAFPFITNSFCLPINARTLGSGRKAGLVKAIWEALNPSFPPSLGENPGTPCSGIYLR